VTQCAQSPRHRAGARAALVARVTAAVAGGFAMAVLTSMATLALPWSRVDAVLGGTMLGILMHAAIVVWVFAARTALRAWVGMVVLALPLLCAAWYAQVQG